MKCVQGMQIEGGWQVLETVDGDLVKPSVSLSLHSLFFVIVLDAKLVE